MAPEAWSTEPLTQFLACSSSMAGGICRATISDAVERLGISGTCHGLRRWCASTMIANGESLMTLQQLLGHSLVATRQHYVMVAGAHRVGALLAPASSLVERT